MVISLSYNLKRPDDVPVYLKCGFRDKVLFWITVSLTAFNTFRSYYFLLKHDT